MPQDTNWKLGSVLAGVCALGLVLGPAAVKAEEDEDRAGLGVMLTDRDDTVRVLSVLRGSPADEAGLRRGDEIHAINGQSVESVRDVQEILREKQPDDTVEIEYRRDGETETMDVELTYRREALRWAGRDARRALRNGEQPGMGVTILERNGRLSIHSVERGSPADEAGLRRGDQIKKIDGERVESARDFIRKITDKDPGDEIEISYRRNDETKTAEVELVPRRAAFRMERRAFRDPRDFRGRDLRDRDRDFRDRDIRFRPEQEQLQRQLQTLQRQVMQLQRELQQMQRQQPQPDRLRDDRFRDDRQRDFRDDRYRDDRDRDDRIRGGRDRDDY